MQQTKERKPERGASSRCGKGLGKRFGLLLSERGREDEFEGKKVAEGAFGGGGGVQIEG